ncbi:General substrate transporter [Kalmanozyma brasiliensis GHG001]|uniref:General substrate transporter n=1 Tax=Kalmanozyma brasiliensis (strain GHG001) TaxID=1365824 RepID=UPI002867BA65|nr:General substrate transporter [Kalmanozyma brasiliensis GHG001]EST09831.2 General substrate transporter [Kalmanozyma brasiliensis GHG001]
MSSPQQDSRSLVASGSPLTIEDEGGHSSWLEQPNSTSPVRPTFPSLPSSSRLQPSSLPSSLPRHLSTRSLGRPSSARTSSDTPRRPPLVDRVTSTRSLYLPSINYSGDTHDDWRSTALGSTPLDRTMDRIGMGRYQWTVLLLSGLGWAADNMWIQAIAIILPHIQRYFVLTDGIVGLASSSIFVGMFVGSIAWGVVSDSYGRRAAFNVTLAVTAVFGTLAAMAGSFALLCVLLFAVGTGVGGSMPTDSSNLVENLPVRKHSYVTALSVFFSAGSVVSSLIGLAVLSASDPDGWRWLLGALAGVTVVFVSARVAFFRLLESPKYLVHAGRPQEARDILQKIHRYNGGATISLRIQDVEDHSHTNGAAPIGDLETSQHSMHQRSSTTDAAPEQQDDNEQSNGQKHSSHRFRDSYTADEEEDDEEDIPDREASSRPLLNPHTDDQALHSPKSDSRNSINERPSSTVIHPSSSTPDIPPSLTWLPSSWQPSASDLVSRYSELFSPSWKRTTLLIWVIWGGMSYGFTTFNVLLPKLLESRYDSPAAMQGEPDDASIRRAMLDILLYSLSSLPGSLISAYMVETRLGRIGTMVSSTAIMAAAVLVFSLTYWRSSLTVVSVSSSISYAAIYGYTPEVMAPTIRATACGTASAISRVAGIIAPLLAGWAFSLSPAVPLFMATSVLVIVTSAMALLPIETRGRATDGNGVASH